MYLLISGLWVNTAHIVAIDAPQEGKSMLVHLANGDRIRVHHKDAPRIHGLVTASEQGRKDVEAARKRK